MEDEGESASQKEFLSSMEVVDGELERLPEVSDEGGVAGGVETPLDEDEVVEKLE